MELQLAIQNYQVNIPNPDRYLLIISNTDTTYITYLLQAHQQLLRAEEHSSTATTIMASAPILSGPAAITTLAPDATLSYTPEVPSRFLSKFPSEMPVEEPISVPDYEPIDSPSSGLSIFPFPFPSDLPLEEPI